MSAFQAQVKKHLEDLKGSLWIELDINQLPYLFAQSLTNLETLAPREAFIFLGLLQSSPLGGADFKETLKQKLMPLGKTLKEKAGALVAALQPMSQKPFVQDLLGMLDQIEQGDFSKCVNLFLWLQIAKQTRRMMRIQEISQALTEFDHALGNTQPLINVNAHFVKLAAAIYDYQANEEAHPIRKKFKKTPPDEDLKAKRRKFFNTLNKYIAEFRPLELLALLDSTVQRNPLQFSPLFIKRLGAVAEGLWESVYQDRVPYKIGEFREMSRGTAVEQQLFYATEYERQVRLHLASGIDVDPAEQVKTITPGALEMVATLRRQQNWKYAYHATLNDTWFQRARSVVSRLVYQLTHSPLMNRFFQAKRSSHIDDMIDTPEQSRSDSLDKSSTIIISKFDELYTSHQTRVLTQHSYNYHAHAANNGKAIAKIELARYHEEGFGVPKSPAKALGLYLQVPYSPVARYRAGVIYAKHPELVHDGSHQMMAANQWIACIENNFCDKAETGPAATHSILRAARKLAALCITDALVYVQIKNNHPAVLSRLIDATECCAPLVSKTMAAWQANDKDDFKTAAKCYASCLTTEEFGRETTTIIKEICKRNAAHALRLLAKKHPEIFASLLSQPEVLKALGPLQSEPRLETLRANTSHTHAHSTTVRPGRF
jgi:hypothetical protein